MLGDESQAHRVACTTTRDSPRSNAARSAKADADSLCESPQQPIREPGPACSAPSEPAAPARSSPPPPSAPTRSRPRLRPGPAPKRFSKARARRTAAKNSADRSQAGNHPFAAQAAHRKQFVLQAALRQPVAPRGRWSRQRGALRHRGRSRSQFFTQRDRRKQMTAGAAARDYHLHRTAGRRDSASSAPSAAIAITIEVPP